MQQCLKVGGYIMQLQKQWLHYSITKEEGASALGG